MIKPFRSEAVEVVYSSERWNAFEGLRAQAKELMEALAKRGLESIVHGSVARGDVDERSDVDVFVLGRVPSYAVELALLEAGFQPRKRELVMATPWQLPKAHIYVGENSSATFPLVKPKRLELEFYYFGGAADLKQVKRRERVAGVDKRLMLIEPTARGHMESPIVGREGEVAKRIGVSLDIVLERAQVLTRRAKIGRTGVFLQRELGSGENFEAVFKDLVKRRPPVKLRLRNP